MAILDGIISLKASWRKQHTGREGPPTLRLVVGRADREVTPIAKVVA